MGAYDDIFTRDESGWSPAAHCAAIRRAAMLALLTEGCDAALAARHVGTLLEVSESDPRIADRVTLRIGSRAAHFSAGASPGSVDLSWEAMPTSLVPWSAAGTSIALPSRVGDVRGWASERVREVARQLVARAPAS